MLYKRKKKSDKAMPSFKKEIKVKKSPNYKAKLDKIFSEYIRLRDSKNFGFKAFKCISCGQIKPYAQADCGHYFSRVHLATRFDELNCNAECKFCLTPDALILTSDFYWKRLGELKVGDKIFGFDENIIYKTSRRYRTATVTHIHNEMQDVYEVELENGDTVKTTADHKWLARARQGTSYTWIRTKDMWVDGVNMYGNHKTGPHTDKTTTVVCKPFQVVHQEKSYESGWLAGMLDADGHICQQTINNPDGTKRYGFRVGIAQCEKYMDICNQIKELLERFTGNKKTCRQTMDKRSGFGGTCTTWQFLITGTNVEKLQFLMRTRPYKMIKVDIERLGKLKSQYDTKVKSIRYVGKEEIVVMETDTHTFIANGYAMHNCNRFKADHLEGYREHLIEKIGEARFEFLRLKHTNYCKMGDLEYKELIKYYQAKIKLLKNGDI